MLPMNLSFLSMAALFVGVFLLSFLDFGDDDEAESEAGADLVGTDGDDSFDDPLGGSGGTIDLLARRRHAERQ